MYISRANLDPSRLSYSEIVQWRLDNPYETHRSLWRLFSADPEPQGRFLFRNEIDGSPGRFIVVSSQAPNPIHPWRLETKPYAPRLLCGERLAFQVTVNPVVTRKDADGRRKRHDVVMDLKKRLGWRDQALDERPSEAALEHQAGSQWLLERCEERGFFVDPMQVLSQSYRQYRIPKRKGGPLQFSTLDLSGVLTVTDAERFQRMLFEGLGPAKGFGCGLLLVRRVGNG